MTQLEDIIYGAVIDASKQYLAMANQTLWHAPESYLQTVICQTIHKKTRKFVYPDVTFNWIHNEICDSERIVHKDIKYMRPDITVFYKSKGILDVCEIKKTKATLLVEEDANKLKKLIKKSNIIKSGYLICYTESNSDHKEGDLHGKFSYWANQTNSRLVKWDQFDHPHEKRKKSTGFCILKVVP